MVAWCEVVGEKPGTGSRDEAKHTFSNTSSISAIADDIEDSLFNKITRCDYHPAVIPARSASSTP